MGKPMPVAVVYGCDDSLVSAAALPHPHPGCSEYDVSGGLRQKPLELVACETSNLEVPASAEIVIEGTISTDPTTFEMEGPFGEWRGFYGEARKRPVIKVDCVTFRDDPIFRGTLNALPIGIIGEVNLIGTFAHNALLWNILESQGIPGVIDVVSGPWTIIKIHKTERGQARRIAAALWGSHMGFYFHEIVVVVEEDVDIHNFREVQFAILNCADPKKDLVVFPATGGDPLNPSQSAEDKDELRYGAGKINRLLIDATIDWETHPKRKEWGNKRFPPRATDAHTEMEELVKRRWSEYGF
jgi:4-hydroxy-3-polyprenylbenzoate decarboxylase